MNDTQHAQGPETGAVPGKRSAGRSILALGLPMLGGMAFDTLYSITDAFFAARVQGGASAALAAVGAACPLLFVMVALAQGIGAGTSIEAGLATGSGDRDRQRRAASSGAGLALWAGLAVALVFLVAARPLMRLAAGRAAPDIMAEGAAYLRWLAPGLPCLFLGHAIFAARQGEGLTKRYGFAMGLSTAVNAVLDPVLMLGLGMGVVGNAIGTSVSQMAFLALALLAARADEGSGPLGLRRRDAEASVMRRIAAIGLPQSLAFIAIGLAQGAANLILARNGATALASQTLASRFEGIAIVPTLAFASAASILVSQARGSGDARAARDALRGGMVVIGIGSAVFCGLLAGFARPLCLLLAGEPRLAELAAVGAAILATGSAIGHSSGILGASVLLAAEKPAASLAAQALRLLVLPVPLALLAQRLAPGSQGPVAAWIGLAAGLSLGGLASLAWAARSLRASAAVAASSSPASPA